MTRVASADGDTAGGVLEVQVSDSVTLGWREDDVLGERSGTDEDIATEGAIDQMAAGTEGGESERGGEFRVEARMDASEDERTVLDGFRRREGGGALGDFSPDEFE